VPNTEINVPVPNMSCVSASQMLVGSFGQTSAERMIFVLFGRTLQGIWGSVFL